MKKVKRTKTERKRKSRSDSDGVIVKRSWYSFSKYYPGGGSSQKYRKVMNETPEPHRQIKVILTVFALFLIAFIGYFTANVAIDISNAPTTAVTEESTTLPSSEAVPDTTKAEKEKETTEKKKETTREVTFEEPEREVNVTTLMEISSVAE